MIPIPVPGTGYCKYWDCLLHCSGALVTVKRGLVPGMMLSLFSETRRISLSTTITIICALFLSCCATVLGRHPNHNYSIAIIGNRRGLRTKTNVTSSSQVSYSSPASSNGKRTEQKVVKLNNDSESSSGRTFPARKGHVLVGQYSQQKSHDRNISTASFAFSVFNISDLSNVSNAINSGVSRKSASSDILSLTTTRVNQSFSIASRKSAICGIRNPTNGELRPLRILMSSSEQYIPVILNWLIYFRKICNDRAVIYNICLDKETESAMQTFGLQCSYSYHARNRGQLWTMRARVTKQLLDQGYDVLMTDSDALWLKNPFAELDRFDKSDIIGSRASFPEHVSKRLGATLCMGFVYIKCTAVVKKLYEDLVSVMSKEPKPDDQRDLNDLLMRKGLSYPIKPTYQGSQQASTGVAPYTGSFLRVTLLPHGNFRRICEGISVSDIRKAVVVHCLSEKTGTSKQGVFGRIGLWTLNDNWRNISTGVAKQQQGRLDSLLDEASTVINGNIRRLADAENRINIISITTNLLDVTSTRIYRDPSFKSWGITENSTLKKLMTFEDIISKLN